MVPLGSHAAPGLLLYERLGLRVAQPFLLIGALVRSVGLYWSYRGSWPWKRLLAVSLLRMRRVLSTRQRQAASPQTGSVIAAYAVKAGVEHNAIPIKVEGYPDIWLHELDFGMPSDKVQESGHHDGSDREKSDKVLFYAHGGGFAHPITPQHLELTRTIIHSLKGRKVYLPEYSLSPAEPYPTATVQVITALEHVLSVKGASVAPERLVLAGDSAGGSLIATALAHMLHPSPLYGKTDFSMLVTDKAPRPLAGAILIAPYATMHRDGAALPASFNVNASIDFLTRAADLNFQRLYAPPSGDVYAEPGIAPADFWSNLGDVVSKVQVTAGEWEVIRDDALQFGGKLRQSSAKVVVQVAKGAVHVEPCVDFAVGSAGGEQLRLLKEFCAELSA